MHAVICTVFETRELLQNAIASEIWPIINTLMQPTEPWLGIVTICLTEHPCGSAIRLVYLQRQAKRKQTTQCEMPETGECSSRRAREKSFHAHRVNHLTMGGSFLACLRQRNNAWLQVSKGMHTSKEKSSGRRRGLTTQIADHILGFAKIDLFCVQC